MSKLRVAVIAGGPSREAAVSRSSAAEVVKALGRSAIVELMELDAGLTPALSTFRPDVVFPVLHGPPGEDGTMQGYLEILGHAYVGSGVHASATAMDKSLAKAVFRRVDLPVCDDVVFAPHTPVGQAASAVRERFGDRVVVKPLRQGSAIGVTPVMNGGDLAAPLELAFALGDGVLVEPFVLGMEATVGVLDVEGTPPRAFPPIEIRVPEGTWYDYSHRYTAGESEHVIPARVSATVRARLESIAVAAHRALGCRDLSRADFIVTDSGQIVLLEVNTLPGMTPTSLYPDGAKALGIDFATLMMELVYSAHRRAQSTTAQVMTGR
jgi:D-alanine-D-alanine ligase